MIIKVKDWDDVLRWFPDATDEMQSKLFQEGFITIKILYQNPAIVILEDA